MWLNTIKRTVKTSKTDVKRGRRLVIAFKIEDEYGKDITPPVSNILSTPLNDGVVINRENGVRLLLAIRNFIFRAGGNELIRHLFPDYKVSEVSENHAK